MRTTLRGKLRSSYAELSSKSPRAAFYARRLYKRKYVNKVSRKIRGRSNIIQHDFTSVLDSVCFDIVGDSNRIEIAAGCLLENMTFYVRGNNHRILIGRECSFGRGSVIWFEDRKSVV